MIGEDLNPSAIQQMIELLQGMHYRKKFKFHNGIVSFSRQQFSTFICNNIPGFGLYIPICIMLHETLTFDASAYIIISLYGCGALKSGFDVNAVLSA